MALTEYGDGLVDGSITQEGGRSLLTISFASGTKLRLIVNRVIKVGQHLQFGYKSGVEGEKPIPECFCQVRYKNESIDCRYLT